MIKKLMTLSLLILLIIGVSGCTDNQPSNQENDISTMDLPVNNVRLNESDFPESYTLLYDNYTKDPTVQENQTGNGLTWHILERYDGTYYDVNSTDGVMQSILKLDSKENATRLVELSEENLLDFNYTEQNMESIGDASFILAKDFTQGNVSYTYYTMMFSIDTVVVALGGSVPDMQTFLDYADIIKNRIYQSIQQL